MCASRVSVLIVGAGPSGLTAAIALAQAGMDVRVVDAAVEYAGTSRAAVIHAHTLESLDSLDLTDRIMNEAIIVQYFAIRDFGRTIGILDFTDLPTPYPCAAMLSQARTEAIMRERLGELEVAIESGTQFVGLDGLMVTVERDGVQSTIQADIVIGADGVHSTVRDAVGIRFPGHGYAQSFVLADVAMTWPVPRDTVTLNFHRDGAVVVAPLPGNRFRVVASTNQVPQHPTVSDIEGLLHARTGHGTVDDLRWSGRFRVHHRLASTYHRGNVYLIGDAAHVHSPAGGQGMNMGVVDAITLAHCIIAGDDDRYEQVRRPIARRVLRTTDVLTRGGTVGNLGARGARNALIFGAMRVSPLAHRIAMDISQLSHNRS